jgi:hypothetical protein
MNAFANVRQSLKNFHESERADIPVGTVLVVAFIVVPLVILLVFYRKELVTKFKELWKAMFDAGSDGAAG